MLDKKTILFFTDDFNTAIAENIKAELKGNDEISVIITRKELKNFILDFIYEKIFPEGSDFRCRLENRKIKKSAKKMDKVPKDEIEYNNKKKKQKRTLNALNRYNPDVVCITAQSALYDCLAAVDQYAKDVKVAVIGEDFVLDKRLIRHGVDRFFVDNYDMRNALCEGGIPDDRIEISGLPVNEAFFSCAPREEAVRRMALDRRRPTILISASVMGDNRFIPVAEAIAAEDFNANIVVCCGKNRHFLNAVRDLGFEAYNEGVDLNAALDACDIVVARPTTMILGAALAKKKPIIALLPNGEAEKKNMEYLAIDRIEKVKDTDALIASLKARLEEYFYEEDIPQKKEDVPPETEPEEKIEAIPYLEEHSARTIAQKLREMATQPSEA